MKKRLIVWLLSCCFIVTICLFSSNLLAIDIVQITNTSGINERHPRIVMKDSLIYVIWWHENENLIYFCRSINAGQHWDTPLKIWNGNRPSIALSESGDIYIVWENNKEILFSKSTNGGISFEDTVKQVIR